MKRKPYINDNEFAEENFTSFFEPHTEPHPFRLMELKNDKKKPTKTKQKEENI
jgi:hypothetical protein